MLSCPINYQIQKCSSSDYGLDCSTCRHTKNKGDKEMIEVKVYGKKVIKKPYVELAGERGSGAGIYDIKYDCYHQPMFFNKMHISKIPSRGEYLKIGQENYMIDMVIHRGGGLVDLHIDKVIVEELDEKEQLEAENKKLKKEIEFLKEGIKNTRTSYENLKSFYNELQENRVLMKTYRQKMENSLWVRIGRKLRLIR